MKNYLRIKDLIEILKSYDPNLPVIITDSGKNHQYGLKQEDIHIHKHPYFGNDSGAEIAYGMFDEEGEFVCNQDFLNIGSI